MQTWLSIEEFAKLIGKSISEVNDLCQKGELEYKVENDHIFIEATLGTQALVPSSNEVEIIEKGSVLERTVGTILNLHEKVLNSKDETLDALRTENEFLKESLISMQELYNEDRKTVETLQKQLKITQDELEFMRRKYKLMWGKVVEKSK
jgi:hypothetical protein